MHRADSSARGIHVLLRLLPFALLFAVAAFTGPGCRHKDHIVNPPDDTTQPGSWRLVIRAPEVMYINDIFGHVNNDTLTVRLYDPLGMLHAGVPVYTVSLSDPGKVTFTVVSSADTVHRPWGTSGTPLMYWGVGGEGGQESHESLSSWVIFEGDTVARATAGFIVRPDTTAP